MPVIHFQSSSTSVRLALRFPLCEQNWNILVACQLKKWTVTQCETVISWNGCCSYFCLGRHYSGDRGTVEICKMIQRRKAIRFCD